MRTPHRPAWRRSARVHGLPGRRRPVRRGRDRWRAGTARAPSAPSRSPGRSPLPPRAPGRARRRSPGRARSPPRARSFSSSSLAAGTAALSSSARRSARRRCSQRLGGAPEAQPIGLRVHRGRREPARRRQDEQAERGRVGIRQRLQQLAGAAGQPAPGSDLRGHIGAERRAELAQQRARRRAPTRAAPAAARRPRPPSRPPGRRLRESA